MSTFQGKQPRPVYIDQAKVEWSELNKDKTELEVTTTTDRNNNNIPVPKDEKKGGRRFVADHVLELMVVQAAFDDNNRKYNKDAEDITDAAWKKAKEAVQGDAAENCKKVAEKISKCVVLRLNYGSLLETAVLDNLLGIADRVNLAKEAVFTKVVKDNTDEDIKEEWVEYLKAIAKYLEDFEANVEKTADNTGDAFKDFTSEDKVGSYFATFCKDKYKAGRDYVKAQLDKQKDDGEQTAQCLKAGSKQSSFISPMLFYNCADDC
ncbi:MAG: hypothetical protein LQ349_003106 [Xanthoria aureola]|nr:MAG: hypothetical protein LQ349_003106 [Xanthoria aureola]